MIRTEMRLLPIILFTLLATVTFGCSTAIQDSPLNFVDGNGSHPAGWTTAHGTYAEPDGSLCMDCHGDDLAGGISGASCSANSYNGQSCHASGPGLHPADWLNKNASGDTWHADAYQEGLLQGGLDCLDCHTPPALDDPYGGKCLICHFDLNGSRTPGGWIHGTTDHGDFAGLPEEIVCVTCHEVNNRFGNEPTCHNCHTIVTVPHTNGWLDMSAPDFHALAYSPADDSCNVCHDPAQPANPPGYICLDCHFSEDGSQRTPPGSSYTHGETSLEHKTFTANEAQVCINCHNTNLDYANQDSCHNCHDLVNVPHTSGWLNKSNPDFHALVYSPADDSCSVCHDPAQPANPPGYICLDCHFSEDGSRRTPPGSSYTHGETSSEHKTFTANEAQVCINCHNTNLDYANQDSCHNCHDLVTVPHTSGWLDRSASDFHAQEYSPADDSCSVCHDPAQPANGPGYICLDCHFSEDGSQRTPPGSSYTHGETSSEHKTFTANEAQVCINCHNTNLDYANQTSCHNCHDLVNVPHTSGWLDRSDPDFHALAYSPSSYSCSTCHDPAQPANGPGYICLDCHFSEDGNQRTPSGSSYIHGDTSGEHQAFSANAAQVCINCHTTNFDNANQTSCHNCHDIQAAHTVEYLDHNLAVPTSSDFTSQCSSCHSLSGTSPVVGAPVCISCHAAGSPYSQTNCTSCHRRPPGTGEHGEHIGEASCDDCHQSAGSDSGLNHFYDGAVDVVFSVSGFTFNGSTCTGSCHGENHSNRNW